MDRMVRVQWGQRHWGERPCGASVSHDSNIGGDGSRDLGPDSWLHVGRPGVLGMISGAVAGLVAITPASGFVDASGAILIGIGAGAFCYGGIILRRKFGFDDALDVWGVHGIDGTWGAIATGFFATTAVNAAGKNGLFYGGGANLLLAQLVAVAVVWVFAFSITAVVMWTLSKVMRVRMTKEEERIGADLIQHGESAYGEVNGMMKVEAIIRSEKLGAVKTALEEIKVHGMTVSEVQGYGE